MHRHVTGHCDHIEEARRAANALKAISDLILREGATFGGEKFVALTPTGLMDLVDLIHEKLSLHLTRLAESRSGPHFKAV